MTSTWAVVATAIGTASLAAAVTMRILWRRRFGALLTGLSAALQRVSASIGPFPQDD